MSRTFIRTAFGFPEVAGAVLDLTLENDTSPAYVQQTSLSSGNNTVSKPASAGGVVIIPPENNTAVLTLKGVNGDTGVALHATGPTMLTLKASVTTFVLNASAAVTDIKFVWL